MKLPYANRDVKNGVSRSGLRRWTVVAGLLLFAISATLSVAGYGVTGEITLDRFLLALALLPAMLLGAWASKHFHGLVDRGWLRPSVLVLSTIAGTIAVVRGLV